MSDAARDQVNAIPQQQLKGSKRTLLEKVAELIAEGETMTRPIADWELAPLVGVDERTIRSGRRALVEDRLIRVVGGGRGRPASYELLDLPGAGAEPSLPLIGEVPRPRPATEQRPTPLFDAVVEPERSIRSYTVGSKILRSAAYVGSLILPFATNVSAYVGSLILRTRVWAYTVGSNVGSLILRSRMDVDVDDARARGTYTLKDHVHTHAPPPNSRPAHPWHAWCATSRGACVPRQLHDEYRRKLQLTDQQLFAIYAEECAALAPDAKVSENDFTFWRPRLAARFSSVAPVVERSPPRPRQKPDILVARPWKCPHEQECGDRDACIEQQGADWRARQKRRSGT